MNKPKIIVIGGPTASGKSQLALDVAKKFNGEIVNTDSRQFYIGMDIGTGKEVVQKRNEDGSVQIQEVKHHLIDILKPDEEFNLFKFQKLAFETIDKIIRQNKLPILVGGTGLYIDSIVYNYQLIDKNIDEKRRVELGEMELDKLQALLEKLNKKTFDSLSASDKKNPHRLIRAIERAENGTGNHTKAEPLYDTLYLVVSLPKDELNNRIDKRVNIMFDTGLLNENENLRKEGYNTNLNSMKSIGYREFDKNLSGDQTIEQTKELIKLHSRQYVKRQNTWFKRNKDIKRISDPQNSFKIVSNFLT